ncbi:hypothetical protein KPH14_003236 [Odynerus spinipes]|uniref:UDP-glycosyltransferase n=1 Tax=Odynerus spinipes TaxID=1348599 RepID=A0AAD9RGN5_9HYME|nr:hypothetical protein KPH14_003236 [Odynerus spinipes]
MKFNSGVSLLIVNLILLACRLNSVSGKRILIITPSPAYSHQITYRSLWRELHARGHELVIVTPYPIGDPNLTNYTEIYFDVALEKLNEVDFGVITRRLTLAETRVNVNNLCHFLTEKLLEFPDFRKFYVPESNEKFDAVIVETILSPVFFLLGERFDAPLIGVLSMQLHNIDRYFMGSPILESHLSNWETEGITENPTFWQRLRNFIDTWHYMYNWFYNFLPIQQSLARKYFGDNLPDILEAGKNMSLILSNSHALNLYSRPDVPTVIYYNGGHISKIPPSLPTDLREFLDNATDGFIYMSLGSTVRYNYLSGETISLFADVFSKLPWPVVWKRDDAETVANLSYYPNKVFVSKWLPQQGILAHPNIKLFIYQGGLQSTEEAMHYSVPLLGIPVMFDQEYNVKKIESLGVGQHLPLPNLTEKSFYDAIREIIHNKRYKQKMLEVNSLLKDVPFDTLQNAAWWIEYVIRTKGAPHLQFSEKYKPLYQQYNVDVIAFLLMATNVIIVVLLCLILTISFYVIKLRPSSCVVRLLKKGKEKLH